MARRAKDDSGERRTSGLRVQMTPSEKAELQLRAATTGRSLSDFARLVLLSDAKKPAPSPRSPQAIRALAGEISRVGNNINQLARYANEMRHPPSERALQQATAELVAALQKVMAL